jgi:hypothetical protein
MESNNAMPSIRDGCQINADPADMSDAFGSNPPYEETRM